MGSIEPHEHHDESSTTVHNMNIMMNGVCSQHEDETRQEKQKSLERLGLHQLILIKTPFYVTIEKLKFKRSQLGQNKVSY